jgi:hypothetical protein
MWLLMAENNGTVLSRICHIVLLVIIGVWQGVAMDSIKFHLGLPSVPCLTKGPAGGPPLKRVAQYYPTPYAMYPTQSNSLHHILSCVT